jgi:predicted Zn-dependent protease
LAKEGNARAAVDRLEALLDRFPRQAALLWYLGGIYLFDLQDVKRAITLMRRSTKAAPHSERASLGLFHALWEAGRSDAAFEEMRRFQQLTNFGSEEYAAIVRQINGTDNDTEKLGKQKPSKGSR